MRLQIPSGLFLAFGLMPVLTACGPAATPATPSNVNNPGPQATGRPPATSSPPVSSAPSSTAHHEIRGQILRAAGQPLGAAKVLLLGEQDQELTSLKTDNNGTFAFPNLAAGNYRIRFTHPDDLQGNPLVEYKPTENRSTDFFDQLTSQKIHFEGSQSQRIDVAPLTVGWKPNLTPEAGTVSTNHFPNFSWGAAPNASSYAMELLNLNASPFYRSPDQSGVTYQLQELKGNQGSSSGQAIKGGEYLYRVRVGFTPGSIPGPEYGYSTVVRLRFE